MVAVRDDVSPPLTISAAKAIVFHRAGSNRLLIDRSEPTIPLLMLGSCGQPVMSFTLRPAQAFVALDCAQDRDDFDVMDGSRRVGRLYRAESGVEPWCWSISSAVSASGTAGRAVTRILALQALADTYYAVKALNNADSRHQFRALRDGLPRGRTIRTVASLEELGSLSRAREP